ncbi:hypothetical protein GTZ85_20615 [Streptomyces sp. SID5474]|nr:hypothetical protein [Streptomyces sp. SID5474]
MLGQHLDPSDDPLDTLVERRLVPPSRDVPVDGILGVDDRRLGLGPALERRVRGAFPVDRTFPVGLDLGPVPPIGDAAPCPSLFPALTVHAAIMLGRQYFVDE